VKENEMASISSGSSNSPRIPISSQSRTTAAGSTSAKPVSADKPESKDSKSVLGGVLSALTQFATAKADGVASKKSSSTAKAKSPEELFKKREKAGQASQRDAAVAKSDSSDAARGSQPYVGTIEPKKIPNAAADLVELFKKDDKESIEKALNFITNGANSPGGSVYGTTNMAAGHHALEALKEQGYDVTALENAITGRGVTPGRLGMAWQYWTDQY
jgi:hypothetical protein